MCQFLKYRSNYAFLPQITTKCKKKKRVLFKRKVGSRQILKTESKKEKTAVRSSAATTKNIKVLNLLKSGLEFYFLEM